MQDSENEEVITTARPSPSNGPTPRGRSAGTVEGAGTGSSVVREWVDELTGRTERGNPGIRAPSDAEITLLTGMFPDVERDVVLAALQRSPNIERAAEILLTT
jgi:hypothetical protein